MLLLFASDLHGAERHYRTLAQAVASVRPDVLVLGGDLFPDDPPNDPERMGMHQAQYVQDVFRPWTNTIMKIAPQLRIAAIPGNRDWLSSAIALDELASNNPHFFHLAHDRAVEFDGLSFVGYSRTPPTPGYIKDFERLDLPGDFPPAMGGARWDPACKRAKPGSAPKQFAQFPSMAEELAHMLVPQAPWVFVAHAPPFETDLDRNYHREAIGSRAIRAAIEKNQPLLSLHGHVHESADVSGSHVQKLGATTAVNIGQHVEQLYYGIIEVDVPRRRVVQVERRAS